MIPEYGRVTREQRKESANLHTGLKSSYFNSPSLSKAGQERILQALNNNPPLKKGESGDAVKALQKALLALGDSYIGIPAGPTGNFGEQTEFAVKTFQKRWDLQGRDGQAGNETLGRLDGAIVRGEIKVDSGTVKIFAPNWAAMPRVVQPWGEGTCWAAAMSMLYFWKHPIHFDLHALSDEEKIRYVLRDHRTNPNHYLALFAQNADLKYHENIPFHTVGYGMLSADSGSGSNEYGLDFWKARLNRSPCLISGAKVVDGHFKGHAFVLVGVEQPKSGPPMFHCINPQDGKLSVLTQIEFMLWIGDLPQSYKDADDFWSFLRNVSFPDWVHYRDRVFYW
jgi:hypothetical protein